MRIGSGGSTGAATKPWLAVSPAFTFSGVHRVQAVAAEYSKIQLLNPVASGVTLYVMRLIAFGAVANFDFVQQDTALANAVANLGSKQLGAAAPAAEMYQDTEGAIQSPYLYSAIVNSYPELPGEDFSDDPWQLDQGVGILAQGESVNRALYAIYEWIEVAI